MATQKWEVDVEEMTLNDLEILEAGMGSTANISQVKEVLGRLVTNRTAEEIGSLKLKDLRKAVKDLRQTIQEMAVPKETATPS